MLWKNMEAAAGAQGTPSPGRPHLLSSSQEVRPKTELSAAERLGAEMVTCQSHPRLNMPSKCSAERLRVHVIRRRKADQQTQGPIDSIKFNKFCYEPDHMEGSVLGPVETTMSETVPRMDSKF